MAKTWEEHVNGFEKKYDRWIAEGKIKKTSKVIPIQKSLAAQQWVMPTEQVLRYLKDCRSFVLTDCSCRKLGQHCDSPLEVCFLLNDYADKAIAQGRGRRVSLEEAEEAIKKAAEAGLIHTTLYNPDQHLYALCNCCDCCCHDMHLLTARGRTDLVAHSDYEAITDSQLCTACGLCVEECRFGARAVTDGELSVDRDLCYGCGQCVPTCPEEAISMARRESR